jgi:hypothetical protein
VTGNPRENVEFREQKMRIGFIVLWMLLCSITSVAAQVSVGIGLPGVNIGINVAAYPQLVAVPGYPVYYAPQVSSNYFFYDGMYWVYQGDNWYASSWYNGPWAMVYPESVPLFVLRVPVRYYRQQPTYFRGWASDAPPRWGEHWGNTWEQSHRGWDNWNRSAVPAPAPLPVYQRQYSGNRYPQVAQQQALQSQNYRYQPHEAVVQQHYQAQQAQSPPVQAAPSPQRTAPPMSIKPPQQAGGELQRPAAAPTPYQSGAASPSRGQSPQHATEVVQRPAAAAVTPQQQAGPAPRGPPPQHTGEAVQRPAAAAAPPQSRPPTTQAMQHEQQAPKAQGPDKGSQGKASPQEPKKGQEKDAEKGEHK